MNLHLIYKLAKATWQKNIAYRLDAVMWIVRGLIMPLILMGIWLVAGANSDGDGWGRSQIITYYLMTTVVLRLTQSWAVYTVGEAIRKGELSNYIIKPLAFWIPSVSDDLGKKILRIFTIIPFTVLVFFVFKDDLFLNPSFIGTIEFVLFLIIGYVINFLVQMIVGFGAFWLNHFDGANSMRELLQDVFSGKLIPLFLLPTSVANIAEVLPFKFIINTPINYLLGTEGLSFGNDLLLGVFWIILLLGVCLLMYKQGIKQFSAIGI